jgi:hypothetical protein
MFFSLFSIGNSKVNADIVEVDGRNHAKLPDRTDLFPLYDYAWRVTVFSVDGLWYRLDNPLQDCEARQQHVKQRKADVAASLEHQRQELAALELKLKASEEALEERRRQFEEEMSQQRAELESEREAILRSETPPIPVTSLPIASLTSVTPANSGNSPLSPTSTGSVKQNFFVAKRPQSISISQRPVPPSAFEGASASAPTISGSHRQPTRAGSTPDGTISSSPKSSLPDSLQRPLPAISSSLPSSSPLVSMALPSSPTPLKFNSANSELNAEPSSLPSPSSLRRVSSLPPTATEPYSLTVNSIPSDPVLSSPRSPHATTPTTPKISSQLLDFEINHEELWTREQCEEWLKTKLYPSTDPNDKTSSGQRSIHCAALDGQLQVVEFLIARGGVDISQKDLIGNTPLLCAASKGRMDTVKWLLSHGAILDAKAPSGRTALHSAAAGGYLDVCELLVQLGSNPMEKEQFGKTPRALAEAYQHKSVIEFLKVAEQKK